jgi:hypothetical protein
MPPQPSGARCTLHAGKCSCAPASRDRPERCIFLRGGAHDSDAVLAKMLPCSRDLLRNDRGTGQHPRRRHARPTSRLRSCKLVEATRDAVTHGSCCGESVMAQGFSLSDS